MDRFKLIKDFSAQGGPASGWGELPRTSGVYAFFTKKLEIKNLKFECIYIGKAINIQSRVKNHFQQPSYRDNLFIHLVNRIGYLETNSEIEALILEANLIKKHQPKYNVVWRDDKNYFYVAINRENIPYVFITHQKIQPKTEYVGPFVEGTALKKTLKYLRRAFPYYTSKKHPKNKCTWCHLGLCPGPNPDLREYRKNLKKLTLILQGKRGAVLNSLKMEMQLLSKENKFEEAGKIRDRINNLQQVMSHSGVIEQAKTNTGSQASQNYGWENTQKILNGLLGLKTVSRIECYDISNIQGNQATGSMVVFTNGLKDKNEYKKFKIKMENKPNDIAMLKEILERRLKHTEWKYPEVMLIDGGIAQLNVAINVKKLIKEARNIKVISIAKRNKDLYIEGNPPSHKASEGRKKDFIPLKSLPQEVYNLILQLDDEAHRFAITYHKKLRKKHLLQ